eukprot:3525780-Alexandrium_andersonii.AAC.1
MPCYATPCRAVLCACACACTYAPRACASARARLLAAPCHAVRCGEVWGCAMQSMPHIDGDLKFATARSYWKRIHAPFYPW